MAVRVLLTTGEQRVVEADGAHVEGAFFVITRSFPSLQRVETVLTLWAENVVGPTLRRMA